jgi:hypothetical protein
VPLHAPTLLGRKRLLALALAVPLLRLLPAFPS